MMCYYTDNNTIRDSLVKVLFQPLDKLDTKMRESLTQKNNKLIKDDDALGFSAGSAFYFRDLSTVPEKITPNDKYRLPELDESLLSEYQKYLEFTERNKTLKHRISDFFAEVLLNYQEHAELCPESVSEEVLDLGKIFPTFLLNLANLNYTSNTYEILPENKSDWDRWFPEVNKLIAMRSVL